MTPYEALITFSLVWWLVLFMALPFGVQREENPVVGHDTGAPTRARMLPKLAITTVIAVVLTAACWWIANSGLIDFHPV